MIISVCLCTYRRQAGVVRTLNSLSVLASPPGCLLELVVVDNDAEGSAQTPVLLAAKTSQWPINYFIEARSGVSFARNRCLKEARGDFVAFIDDDEWCSPDWICRLYETLIASNCDAVFGPVIPQFDAAPPDWLIKSGSFDRARFPTGTPIDWIQSRTGNVLLKNNQQLIGPGFDVAYAFSGGEDVAFFNRLAALGARYNWCDEAPVYESVPVERTSLAWILRRSFAGGKTFVKVSAQRGGFGTYIYMALRGCAGTLGFSALALVSFPISRATALRFARRASGDAGKVISAVPAKRGNYGT